MATETAKGEVIVRQGDTASQFFVVESGRDGRANVDQSFDPSQRAPSITDKNRTKSINEGGHFGELALLSSVERTASVTSLDIRKSHTIEARLRAPSRTFRRCHRDGPYESKSLAEAVAVS